MFTFTLASNIKRSGRKRLMTRTCAFWQSSNAVYNSIRPDEQFYKLYMYIQKAVNVFGKWMIIINIIINHARCMRIICIETKNSNEKIKKVRTIHIIGAYNITFYIQLCWIEKINLRLRENIYLWAYFYSFF